MQKNIIALAIAAAFAAPAVAMADVTVYGSMDGGLRHQINDSIAAGGTTDSMKMGQYNTARWGFKAVDDMGDGMKTNVVLETSLAPGGVGQNADMTSGAAAYPAATMNMTNPFGLIFDRQATIGLQTDMIKFDMGWNYSTSFKTIVSYDPFGGKFLGVTGATTSAATLRNGGMQVNAKFGDVAVNAEYMMNDSYQSRQPAFGSTGRALGVTYASGAINVGAAYTAKEATLMTATGADAGDNSYTHMTAGAGYNFGDGKASVGYAKKTTKPGTSAVNSDSTQTDMWLGANYNMSSALGVTAAYYSRASNSGVAAAADSTNKTMMVGLTYNLSKKTLVYLEMDRAVANTGATGVDDTKTVGTSAGLSTVF